MTVRLAGLHDVERWDKFALENGGSVFHSYAWGDVIERAFEYERNYLIAEEDGKVSGILPVFYLKSFFAGRRLISLPVSDTGGPIGLSSAVHELLQATQQIMLDSSAGYVELKGGDVSEEDYAAGKKYPTFVLNLPQTEEELLKIIGKKNRNLVRKAEKEDITVEEAKTPSDVSAFYDVYARTMKQLGTPPYTKSFYTHMQSILSPQRKAVILLAKKKSEAVGGAIFLLFGDKIYYLAGVSPDEYLKYAPNPLLVYKGLLLGIKEGKKTFDFGRTSTEGVYNFKKSWGGTPKELIYYYKFLNPEKKLPNGKIQQLSPLWRTLVPLRLSKIIGPQIRKTFGF